MTISLIFVSIFSSIAYRQLPRFALSLLCLRHLFLNGSSGNWSNIIISFLHHFQINFFLIELNNTAPVDVRENQATDV